MGTIDAIGGGEISEGTTRTIDEKILSITGKKQNKVLFLPTASGDSTAYCEAFEKYYSSLGCTVKSLLLLDKPNSAKITAALEEADIIYIGGGNTIKLLEQLRKHHLDQLFKRYFETSEKVLCGLSAGALCWFTKGMSDSIPGRWTLIPGLALIPGACAVGFSRDSARQNQFLTFLEQEKMGGFGLDDQSALIINHLGQISTLRDKTSRTASVRTYTYEHARVKQKKL
jgi:dipeptidase E